MPEYRIYLLDEADRIRDYLTTTHPDDATAVAVATKHLTERPGVEIWSGVRMVHRWAPGANREPQNSN